MFTDIKRILFGLNIGYPHPPNFKRSFNIGPLRTLVIASEIAKQNNVPLDVRLWHEPGGPVWEDFVSARVTDAVACLLWMKIDFRNVYELHEKQPDEKMIRDKISPDLVDNAIEVLTKRPGTMCRNPKMDVIWDDIFGQDGTVLVTGDEKSNFENYCETWYGSSSQHQAMLSETRFGYGHLQKIIEMMYDSSGKQSNRFEISVIKTEDGHRMGPLSEDVVWWNIFKPLDPELLKVFLIATAMNPKDPLSMIGIPFSISSISNDPYIWSWEEWYEFISEKS